MATFRTAIVLLSPDLIKVSVLVDVSVFTKVVLLSHEPVGLLWTIPLRVVHVSCVRGKERGAVDPLEGGHIDTHTHGQRQIHVQSKHRWKSHR